MSKGNSLNAAKVFISPTAVTTDLDQAGFAAITDWVQIKNCTNKTEIGNTDELLSEAVMDGAPIRAFGVKNPGDVTLTYVHTVGDAGQAALTTAGKTESSYAFKFEFADSPASDKTNTISYNRAIVSESKKVMGGPSNMDNRTCVIGCEQYWIDVAPADIA